MGPAAESCSRIWLPRLTQVVYSGAQDLNSKYSVFQQTLCMEKSIVFSKIGQTSELNFIDFFKPMILFIIGEKIKKTHRRKPEISLISTHKVPYLLCWNVLCIAQCLKYCMTMRLDEGVNRYILGTI